MFSNFYYYRYPQYCWAKKITGILESGLIDNVDRYALIDAPCGDGVISYWLSKRWKQKLLLCDIDLALTDIAEKNISHATVEAKSIYDLDIVDNNNIWLLVNSLFCLPDKEALLNYIYSKAEYVIGIFPDIEHNNYQLFLQQNPAFENHNAMTLDETLDYFESRGYNSIYQSDVTKIPHYYFKSHLRLAGLTKRALNLFDPLMSSRKGSYRIVVFKRGNI